MVILILVANVLPFSLPCAANSLCDSSVALYLLLPLICRCPLPFPLSAPRPDVPLRATLPATLIVWQTDILTNKLLTCWFGVCVCARARSLDLCGLDSIRQAFGVVQWRRQSVSNWRQLVPASGTTTTTDWSLFRLASDPVGSPPAC
jgi:hypothetical protein